MKNINDKDIKEWIKKKNEVMLQYIIKEYSPLCKFIVKKYIKNSEDIEECLSDIFYNVWSNIEKFDYRKSTFKNWIAGVSRYKAIDYYRKSLKDKSIESGDISRLNNNCSDDEYEVFYEGIHSMIEGLNDEKKKIIIMKFEDDLKPNEITKFLGKDIKYVYNNIERGKKIIKKQYSDKGGILNEKGK